MPRDRTTSLRCAIRSMPLVLILAGIAASGCGGATQPASNAGASRPASTASTAATAPSTSQAPTSPPATTPSPDVALTVDPVPAALIARVSLPDGVTPVAMTEGFDSVWVADHNSTGVYRIDPVTNEISGHIETQRDSCTEGLTVVADQVWQSTCGGSFIIIDPQTNRVTRELFGLNSAASFDGEVWATVSMTSPGAVVRLDPSSLAPVERIAVGADPGYLAVDQQSVWVVNHGDRTVSRVEKASRAVVATIPLGEPSLKGGGAIVVAGDHVWVDHLDDGSIYRIDPQTNNAERIFLGLERSGHYWEQYLHSADNGVWVRVKDGLVVRLSPDTGHPIAAHPVDPGGGDMEVAFGSLWVAGLQGVQRLSIE